MLRTTTKKKTYTLFFFFFSSSRATSARGPRDEKKRERERKKLLPKMCVLNVKKRLFFASKRSQKHKFDLFLSNSARHKKAHTCLL